MKFARELDQDAVPEWKPKYLNYKVAKKRLKDVSLAIKNFNRGTPNSTIFKAPAYSIPQASEQYQNLDTLIVDGDDEDDIPPNLPIGKPTNARQLLSSSRIGSLQKQAAERQPLMKSSANSHGHPSGHIMTRYGSILGSPPKSSNILDAPNKPPSLHLPEPAISNIQKRVRIQDHGRSKSTSAYEAGATKRKKSRVGHLFNSFHQSHVRRLLSMSHRSYSSPGITADYQMDSYRALELAQIEFFGFLDDELDKIDTFYKEKEDEATARLNVLRDQLHILRDRRMKDILRSKRDSTKDKRDSEISRAPAPENLHRVKEREESWIGQIWTTAINGRVGDTSVAMQTEGTPEAFRPIDLRKDYERRKMENVAPYRTAKRKLKLAFLEYYRGLELLKSYAMLNRTAFRKINKKYDKTTGSRPSGRYMHEKVNHALFVKSDVIDSHIQTVEDLYARYFEAGNHKIAANKLRKATRARNYHGDAMFRNGLYIGAGSIFAGFALNSAYHLLHDVDQNLATQTSYLLQLYGGYGLMLLLMLLFALCCQLWTRKKVNYVFIFELDNRDHLDWRQLFEIPCLLYSLLALFMWINFSRDGASEMYIYYPVILITISFIILFLPLPIIYWRARYWFLEACWRLFWSGLYPVEFRDFFLGDMFCSATYSMGNISLFFCLYANDWDNPSQCNSSHSRLLGFFAALPGVWRALQCIRRYKDTRNVFPHLVNCGKYCVMILFYAALSSYRIDKSNALLALLIVVGCIYTFYTTVWDVVMDWSLLNPQSEHKYLRDRLAFHPAFYYAALVIDPILRLNWIFYVIFRADVQHSAFLSFSLALSEVFRRGMWTAIRLDNENSANITRLKASRDIPLPYETNDYEPAALEAQLAAAPPLTPLQSAPPHASAAPKPSTPSSSSIHIAPTTTATTTGSQLSAHTRPSPSSALRNRTRGSNTAARSSPLGRALSLVGLRMHNAHVEDFERRKPDVLLVGEDGDSSDEEVEAADGMAIAMGMAVGEEQRQQQLEGRGERGDGQPGASSG